MTIYEKRERLVMAFSETLGALSFQSVTNTLTDDDLECLISAGMDIAVNGHRAEVLRIARRFVEKDGAKCTT